MHTTKNTKVACIDVSLKRFHVAWVDSSTWRMGIDQFDRTQLIKWISNAKPHMLAIDAPSKRCKGETLRREIRDNYKLERDKYQSMRLCEALLRQRDITIYYTQEKKLDQWMTVGLDLHAELGSQFKLWDEPGFVQFDEEPLLIEVYPHGSFFLGLGRRPGNKKSLTGQLERIAYVLREAQSNQWDFRGDFWTELHDFLPAAKKSIQEASWESLDKIGIQIPVIDHNFLDAVGGLITALRCLDGTAFAVGEPPEGTIVLPCRPRDI